MKVLDADFVRGFIHMADDGWLQGWHEKNAGNISYRIKKWEVEAIREELEPRAWQPIGVSVPHLAWEHFLITGAGKDFRNVKMHPEDCLCILEIDGLGENYRICWGLVNGGYPTSELETHLMNHEVKIEATSGKHRVIYHAHPANIIALTYVLPLKDEVFTRELWECALVFPDAVGVLPWMLPGERDIAVATGELMKEYNVAVWAHHGAFVSAENYDLAFGLMHAVEKSAEIRVKVRSMDKDPQLTMKPDDFKSFAKEFDIEVPEKFLF